jgi:N-methylhydantoinase A
MRMGVDTGGTFTDFVTIQAGSLRIAKRLSTPTNPATALIEQVARGDAPDILVHGTTVATNALLERRGAVTALITTRGFADVLEIGRGDRPSLYDLHQTRPDPLVPVDRRLEVDERTTHDQQVIIPLDDAAITALIPILEAHQVAAIAVCLLHSYANPAHELRIAQILQAHNPAWHISVSHRIITEAREYERTVTAVVNAYVAPVMQRYLTTLAHGLPRATMLRIMASDGGSMGVHSATALPARTTLSGPAGGIVGAFRVAHAVGYERCITFDMGGTSTDVALCDGDLPRSSGSAVGGLPVRIPSLDIHTVGAGGGSIARIDHAGALRVGPQSAGAVPGPACYGVGTQATVTDANVVLGRLRSDAFLGGDMQLDAARAITAIDVIAAAADATRVDAALGVMRVVNAAMARAVRSISVERGHNPKDFTLIAFGGAGPLHAAHLADELGMDRVIVPRFPGVLSALGMATAAVTRSTSRPILSLLSDVTAPRVERILADTLSELEHALQGDGEDPATFSHDVSLAVRYKGQVFELEVPLCAGTACSSVALAAVAEEFHRLHQRRYGHTMHERAIEVTMLTHRVANQPIAIPRPESPQRITALMPQHWVDTHPDDQNTALATAIYAREEFCSGDRIIGPAIVTQLDATTVVPSDWQLVVLDTLDIMLTRRTAHAH